MSVNTKVYAKEVQELFSEKTKGIVFDSGTRQYGSFAKVTAQAGKGYEFAGWYIAGNLVSTDAEIHNWVVAFDLPYDIVNIWDGIIAACEDGIYTVQNAGYNWNINPGQSVTFGFNADAETEKVIEPTNYKLTTVDMN